MIGQCEHTVSLVGVYQRKPKIGRRGLEPNSDSQGGGEGSYWPKRHRTEQWLTGWRRRVLLTKLAQNRTVTHRLEAKGLTNQIGTEPNSDSPGGGEGSYWPQWHRTEQWLTGWRRSVLLTTVAQNRTVTHRVEAKCLTDHIGTEPNSDSRGWGRRVLLTTEAPNRTVTHRVEAKGLTD